MTKEQDQIIEEQIKIISKQAFSNGLSSGAKAMCSVILEKCNDSKLTNIAKVREIRKFCMTSLGEE